MSCLPKPVLRGHASRYRAKTLITALALASAASTSYYLFVAKPKKIAAENFIKTYDPEAHYAEMVKYGYIYSPKKKEEE